MDRQEAIAWSSFQQKWEAFAAEWVGLPGEKLWVNFLANNQEEAELLGFVVDLADHWPMAQSGCLTDCVICDAPESDGAFAGFEAVDGSEPLRLWEAGQARRHPCHWCWVEGAEEIRESRRAEEAELAGERPGTQLLDLPRDLLELIAEKAAVGAHRRWVSLWHVCRRLRWLVLLGEDPPEEVSTELVRAESEGSVGEENSAESEQASQRGWWEEEETEMASGAGPEGRQRFSGKKGDGLTIKQFELMTKGSLADKFKKLQKDVGNAVEGPEFNGKYCIYLGEFLDNPAKLAHEREYEAHCRTSDPVGALLTSLKRHFEDHKEGKAQEWVQFKREPGEELPSLLFRLQGLALDLEKPEGDQELVTKFVTSLDRRLAEQTSSQALAATKEAGGAYTLDEAYEAALRVSAINARLKIARELAPRVADASRLRWSNKPAAAHAATVPAPVQLVAAAPAAPSGGSGACHNCGELGHYRGSCPHPRRNSSGGRGAGAGGGGRGAGRSRACYVCGDTGHLAAQCAKRVVPVAAAAPRPQATQSVTSAEFAEFQAWKATAQAAAAVGAGEEEDEGSDWDDQEYELGAVALPLVGPGVVMAAAGTKEGAVKARATRAAQNGGKGKGGQAQGTAAAGGGGTGVGTAQIAGPVNLAAVEALKARRDKAAAKERLVKLPDHGRQVAPQGLNRLPKGFAVGNEGGGADGVAGVSRAYRPGAELLVQPVVTAENTAAASAVGRTGAGAQQPGIAGANSAVFGEVRLPVALFLDLAERAGLDLATVAALTRGSATSGVGLPVRKGPAVRSLSPIALRAQRARDGQIAASAAQAPGAQVRGAEVVKGSGKHGGSVVGLAAQTVPAAGAAQAAEVLVEEKQAREEVAFAEAVAWADLQEQEDQPESSAMGAARAEARMARGREGPRGDAELARTLAAEERAAAEAVDAERTLAVSRDARVARELLEQEARDQGLDQEAAMCAQGAGAARDCEATGTRKGKAKVDAPLMQAMAWEKKLGAGAWKGSQQLAEVVVQPKEDVVVAAATRAQAMACFAEGRPLVSPAEREQVEGVPDWVDNTNKVVKVMTSKGWWAPERVLLDGGSFYSMAGARLKARLGLTEADMDVGGHRVQTAMGKVEVLSGGLTKQPVPIVLNPGTQEELCVLEKLAFTESTGYDLLIGTRAAYPSGLSVDRWTEQGVYRVNWQTEGNKDGLGRLPAWLGERTQEERLAARPGEGAPARRVLPQEERVGRRLARRWPRGPRLDVAAEAAKAVRAAVGVPRRKVRGPQRVTLPQLNGCQPLDQTLVPALPSDRPLRVLEFFAGVGSATQALARLGYELGEVVACEARGAARVVHAHSLTELAREFPGTVSSRAGAQLHHRFPQDIRLVTRQALQELGPIYI
ncbi:hypothetical protein KFL_007970030 [Klebsormidium nitens]|uniref:CCHC-type domain-containing protein n=1 Tax=Klebsormidium nitens TaxID=105231 RepID=A0A1Y1ITI5_KLENI|nr:hypothetical protein KFL_007970030 [Klebsormidium nitens]|eukprot:GAQ91508.1 hypothetical protein KFL_007970030 [Klebsormidium nitens]